MSVIDTIIPQQAFEIIRDRIGEILAEELANQAILSVNPDLVVTVFSERFIPFDKSELPAVNVLLDRGELGGQTAIQTDGTYRYAIDCYHSAKSNDTKKGDSLAMFKLQRLLGVCRAILEDPKYKTLGFTPPFIMNRHAESIGFAQPNAQDGLSSVMGRLILVVKAPERPGGLISPILLKEHHTNVRLELTDRGYQYIYPEETVQLFNETFDSTFN